MTDEVLSDKIASELLAREARRQVRHRGTPDENESIERRISDEVTADALARKQEREAQNPMRRIVPHYYDLDFSRRREIAVSLGLANVDDNHVSEMEATKFWVFRAKERGLVAELIRAIEVKWIEVKKQT
jgi:hypothetical protein